MWVEDHDYTIVRFNGVFEPQVGKYGFNLHFDSWRLSAGPGLWLPSYIYSQEVAVTNLLGGHVKERSQTRLWSYAPRKDSIEQEFSELTVESPNVVDQPTAAVDRSPVEQQREWEAQAENRVVDRLEEVGLVAPTGEVEKVLNGVVNNIEVTNNIDLQPDIHCRVLVISALELFAIGRTIVISRGLLDVLPDEPSLAYMLAHEMAHILAGDSTVDAFAFADQATFPDVEGLRRFSGKIEAASENAANEKAWQLMEHSPYKDKLASPGLFLRELDAQAKQLPGLLSPHLSDPAFISAKMVSAAPALEPNRLDQIAALPLGSRVKLDPWSDRVELMKSKPVALTSPAEKMPLGLAPFFPYLTRTAGAAAPTVKQ